MCTIAVVGYMHTLDAANPKEAHQAASDYLVRPGGVVNLCYNLPGTGGASDDTFPLGAIFRRSRGVTHVDVPLYHPGGPVRVGHLTFVYGHVGARYGWIARDAVSP